MKRITPYLYIATLLLGMTLLSSCEDYVDLWNHSVSLNARYLYTSTKDLNIDATNNAKETFKVSAVQTSWKIAGMADWLSVSPLSGTDDSEISVTAKANPSADDQRTCVLDLSSAESDYDASYPITVKQVQASPFIRISQSDLSFAVGGGTQTVTVEANVSYTVSSSKDWLKVTASDDMKTLTLQAEANATAEARSATVSLSGRKSATITVTQAPAGITTTQSTTIEAPQSGGTYNLQIKADAAWTATNNGYSWIEVSPASGQAGTSAIALSVTPNTTTSSRTGHVYLRVGSTTCIDIVISQVGLYLNPKVTSLTFDADACSRNLDVESNVTWKVQSKPAWLTVSQEPVTGNKTLTLSVQNYNETTDRQGELVLGVDGLNISRTVKVTQKGRTFQNLVSTLQFKAAASESPFDIDTDGAWTSSTTDSWLTLSQTSGMGKTTVTATVTENTGDDQRTATISVHVGATEQTILVTQDAHFLTISPSSFAESIPSTGGTYQLSITSDDSWQAVKKATWLTVAPPSGNGNIDVTMTAADNPSINDRRDTVTITPSHAQPVRVIVLQAARYLRVNSHGISFFYRGGESDPVLIETDGTYQITQEGDWFTIKENGQTFTVIAGENTTQEKRQGKVFITLTGLKEGESKSIEIPITQRIKTNGPDLEDFTADEDWNVVVSGGSHATITIVGFSGDENWNIAAGGCSFGVTVTGFDDDSNWDNLIR